MLDLQSNDQARVTLYENTSYYYDHNLTQYNKLTQ